MFGEAQQGLMCKKAGCHKQKTGWLDPVFLKLNLAKKNTKIYKKKN